MRKRTRPRRPRLAAGLGGGLLLLCGALASQNAPAEKPAAPPVAGGMASPPRKTQGSRPRKPAQDQPAKPVKPITSLEEWRRTDEGFLDHARSLIEIGRQKRELRDRAGEATEGVEPRDFTPGSIMARRSLKQYASQMDELLRKERGAKEEITRLVRGVLASRQHLIPLLGKRREELDAASPDPQSEAARSERARIAVWLSRLERAESSAPMRFFESVTGEIFPGESDPHRGSRPRPDRRPEPPAPREGRQNRGDQPRGREESMRRLIEENETLRERIGDLEARLKIIEERLATSQAPPPNQPGP